MAEIQKIGHWFFASDRVMTICTPNGTTEGLYVFATPLPLTFDEEQSFSLEGLEHDYYPVDIMSHCVSVALAGEKIVCDIPDNYALFICDNAEGDPEDRRDEEIVIHWSKR